MNSSEWTVGGIGSALASMVPLWLAEPWDNVGLIVGDQEQIVRSVLLAIDLTGDVIDEALDTNCQMILCYHPPIFDGLKKIDLCSPIGRALKAGLALYSVHTAFDAVEGGVNDVLATHLRLSEVEVIRPTKKMGGNGHSPDPKVEGLRIGMGRLGYLKPPVRANEFLARIKEDLCIPQLLVAWPSPNRTRFVHKVGVAAGAGGDLLRSALAHGIDAYVTGELRHHDALLARHHGVMLTCLRHSISERHALKPLRESLLKACPGLQVEISQKDTDPFDFF